MPITNMMFLVRTFQYSPVTNHPDSLNIDNKPIRNSPNSTNNFFHSEYV